MSDAPRILRLGARVAEARRPKHLRAATRLARWPVRWKLEGEAPPFQPEAFEPAAFQPEAFEPEAAAGLDWGDQGSPEDLLGVNSELARWVTHGEVPDGLVPLLGTPTFPDAEPEPSPEPVPSEVPPSANGDHGGDAEQGRAVVGRVAARVVEGIRDGAAPEAAPEVARAPEGDRTSSADARPRPEPEGAPVEGAPVEVAPVEGAPVEGASVEGASVEGASVDGVPGDLPVRRAFEPPTVTDRLPEAPVPSGRQPLMRLARVPLNSPDRHPAALAGPLPALESGSVVESHTDESQGVPSPVAAPNAASPSEGLGRSPDSQPSSGESPRAGTTLADSSAGAGMAPPSGSAASVTEAASSPALLAARSESAAAHAALSASLEPEADVPDGRAAKPASEGVAPGLAPPRAVPGSGQPVAGTPLVARRAVGSPAVAGDAVGVAREKATAGEAGTGRSPVGPPLMARSPAGAAGIDGGAKDATSRGANPDETPHAPGDPAPDPSDPSSPSLGSAAPGSPSLGSAAPLGRAAEEGRSADGPAPSAAGDAMDRLVPGAPLVARDAIESPEVGGEAEVAAEKTVGGEEPAARRLGASRLPVPLETTSRAVDPVVSVAGPGRVSMPRTDSAASRASLLARSAADPPRAGGEAERAGEAKAADEAPAAPGSSAPEARAPESSVFASRSAESSPREVPALGSSALESPVSESRSAESSALGSFALGSSELVSSELESSGRGSAAVGSAALGFAARGSAGPMDAGSRLARRALDAAGPGVETGAVPPEEEPDPGEPGQTRRSPASTPGTGSPLPSLQPGAARERAVGNGSGAAVPLSRAVLARAPAGPEVGSGIGSTPAGPSGGAVASTHAPSQAVAVLARDPVTTPDAPVDKAQQLAQLSGGSLSSDGGGTSTVTFPSPASAKGSASGAANAGCAPETPVPATAREGVQGLDLDAIYDGFVHRLRRDLLHDRERLGDLLGPMR